MKFRTRPCEIHAKQWDGDWKAMKDWCNSLSDGGGTYLLYDDAALEVITLEGRMKADLLDWIICGLEGEFYPCKPSIFHKKYEAAE